MGSERYRKLLMEQPKSVLLRLVIELDPDAIAEEYEEGWTKEDIVNSIEKHVRRAIGNRRFEGWEYIRGVSILDAVSDLDEESKINLGR